LLIFERTYEPACRLAQKVRIVIQSSIYMTFCTIFRLLIALGGCILPFSARAVTPGDDLLGLTAPALPPVDVPEEPLPGFRLARVVFERDEQVVAMQRGEFCAVKVEDASWRPFLDFREKMKGIVLFEEGVHGITFHPQFSTNRLFYLSYTQNEPRRTVISEMKATEGDAPVALPETERILMEIQQPLADHWGGHLVFGPDGMLYIALGDGGLRDDPYALAQNPWVLHGKVLRIDVNGRSGALPYAIPADNPFANDQMVRKEIFALGLRNPWGLSFDSRTGQLWLADVGQDLWEEINLIRPGANYGWSHREGPAETAFHPKPLIPGTAAADPVHSYTRLRGEGICIVGGHLYRGSKLAALNGAYLFADWGYGHVWALEMDDEQHPTRRLVLHRGPAEHKFNPTLITADPEGEPVLLSQEGAIYRLETESAD
jgi:quinoprotein glucose dehydrogenase